MSFAINSKYSERLGFQHYADAPAFFKLIVHEPVHLLRKTTLNAPKKKPKIVHRIFMRACKIWL